MTVIVHTAVANLASMVAALRRLGEEPEVSADKSRIASASRLVLPGVGAFGSGMQRLSELGLVEVIAERVREERPLLAVCLGLQLLCQGSEESPGIAGLGVLDAEVRRFREAPSVPQLGWNSVEADGCRLVETGHAYYANSYCLRSAPAGWSAAYTTHGERFVAALERGPMLACQFHPELSGAWGHALIGRWMAC